MCTDPTSTPKVTPRGAPLHPQDTARQVLNIPRLASADRWAAELNISSIPKHFPEVFNPNGISDWSTEVLEECSAPTYFSLGPQLLWFRAPARPLGSTPDTTAGKLCSQEPIKVYSHTKYFKSHRRKQHLNTAGIKHHPYKNKWVKLVEEMCSFINLIHRAWTQLRIN